MIKIFKMEISKSLKETEKNTIKQVREMNKTAQGLKMEIEAIKKWRQPWKWKPREENRNCRCKDHQQNTVDGREKSQA